MKLQAEKITKPHAEEEYVQIDEGAWAPFPDAFSDGGIKWKLLHVSPEMGSWTAIFDCPAGSSFNAHIHTGPGEYLLTRGRMDVRGGKEQGGDTAIAPGYGFESSGAFHDKTHFPIPSEFYMTFLGPLAFTRTDGSVIANIGWAEAQGAWDAFLSSQKAA
jgi:acetylacetone-cleaving enzyme